MKAFILSTDKALMASMQRVCEMNKPSVAIIPSVPSMQAEGGLNALNAPDLIVLDANSYVGKAIGMLESLAQKYPKAILMLLSSDRSPETLIAAMRLGVREVVPMPAEQADLHQDDQQGRQDCYAGCSDLPGRCRQRSNQCQ